MATNKKRILFDCTMAEILIELFDWKIKWKLINHLNFSHRVVKGKGYIDLKANKERAQQWTIELEQQLQLQLPRYTEHNPFARNIPREMVEFAQFVWFVCFFLAVLIANALPNAHTLLVSIQFARLCGAISW